MAFRRFESSSDPTRKVLNYECLELPFQQRNYVWTKALAVCLLKDLRKASTCDLPDELYDPYCVEEYFMGTAILLEEGKKCKVFDGQQRITTVCLILLAACSFLKSHNDKDSIISFGNVQNVLGLPPAQRQRVSSFRSRLLISEQDMDSYLKLFETIFDERPCLWENFQAEGRIEINFVEIRKELEKATPRALGRLINFVLDSSGFIVVRPKKREDADSVFRVVNTLGLPLSDADKIKDGLWKLWQEHSAKEIDLKSQWEMVEGQVSRNMFPKIVTSTMSVLTAILFQVGLIDRPTLFQSKTIDQLFESLRSLVGRGALLQQLWDTYIMPSFNLCADIMKGSCPVETNADISRQISRSLSFLLQKPFFDDSGEPVWLDLVLWLFAPSRLNVFWDHKKLDKGILGTKFDVKPCPNFLFSLEKMLACGKLGGRSTKKLCDALFVSLVRASNLQKSADVCINEFLTAEGILAQDYLSGKLDDLQFSDDSRPLIRYFLLRLDFGPTEGDVRHDMFDNKLFGITIEHVLPQSFSKNWNWKSSDAYSSLHKLGNLALVAGATNSSASNLSWEAKKIVLFKNNTQRLRKTCELEAFETWTFEDFQRRQKNIITELIDLYGDGNVGGGSKVVDDAASLLDDPLLPFDAPKLVDEPDSVLPPDDVQAAWKKFKDAEAKFNWKLVVVQDLIKICKHHGIDRYEKGVLLHKAVLIKKIQESEIPPESPKKGSIGVSSQQGKKRSTPDRANQDAGNEKDMPKSGRRKIDPADGGFLLEGDILCLGENRCTLKAGYFEIWDGSRVFRDKKPFLQVLEYLKISRNPKSGEWQSVYVQRASSQRSLFEMWEDAAKSK